MTLEAHPLAKLIPDMLDVELAELERDIEVNGQQQPIMLFEGKILDGRHRYAVCQKLGIEPKIKPFPGTEAEARALVISLNVHRRHLSSEQKQKLIETELQRDPGQSDRVIAAKAKVSPTTVGKARAKAEATGKASTVASSKGKDGKTRKRKTRTRKPAAQLSTVDSSTGPDDKDDPVARTDREQAAINAEATATLSKTAKARFDRLVEKMFVALNKSFGAQVAAAVEARVEKAVEDERATMKELQKHYRDELESVRVRSRNLNAWMDEGEFKLVLRCLHPDLQPDDMKVRYTQAFQIFKRLETYMDPKKEPRRENPFKRAAA